VFGIRLLHPRAPRRRDTWRRRREYAEACRLSRAGADGEKGEVCLPLPQSLEDRGRRFSILGEPQESGVNRNCLICTEPGHPQGLFPLCLFFSDSAHKTHCPNPSSPSPSI